MRRKYRENALASADGCSKRIVGYTDEDCCDERGQRPPYELRIPGGAAGISVHKSLAPYRECRGRKSLAKKRNKVRAAALSIGCQRPAGSNLPPRCVARWDFLQVPSMDSDSSQPGASHASFSTVATPLVLRVMSGSQSSRRYDSRRPRKSLERRDGLCALRRMHVRHVQHDFPRLIPSNVSGSS